MLRIMNLNVVLVCVRGTGIDISPLTCDIPVIELLCGRISNKLFGAVMVWGGYGTKHAKLADCGNNLTSDAKPRDFPLPAFV